MGSAKTITIFLPDGNPSSVKIVELSNRTARAFLIPRPKLTDVKTRAELNQPSIYFLCDREGERVYVGECENFFHRIKSHDQGKDFWEVAIAIIAKDNSLEKGDVKFLESIAVEQAKEANRLEVQNAVIPARNNLHEFKGQTILEFFDDIKLIVSTFGYPIFDRVKAEHVPEADLWFCSNKNTQASGIYDENGFTVLAGSLIDGNPRASFAKKFPFASEERLRLLSEKADLIDKTAKIYKLRENVTFKSPNKAGGFCVGGHMNAWTTWKKKDGRTMDEVLRQKLEVADNVHVIDSVTVQLNPD